MINKHSSLGTLRSHGFQISTDFICKSSRLLSDPVLFPHLSSYELCPWLETAARTPWVTWHVTICNSVAYPWRVKGQRYMKRQIVTLFQLFWGSFTCWSFSVVPIVGRCQHHQNTKKSNFPIQGYINHIEHTPHKDTRQFAGVECAHYGYMAPLPHQKEAWRVCLSFFCSTPLRFV